VKKISLLRKLISGIKIDEEISFNNGNGEYKVISLALFLLNNNSGRGSVILGIFTDLTELKAADELIAKRNSLINLFNDVIKFTNKSVDLELSIKYAIDKVCQYTMWSIGHCYMLIKNQLISTKIWNTGLDSRFAAFREQAENLPFITREGMPIKCLQKAKPILLDLAGLKNEHPLSKIIDIRGYGLKTGIWIPVMFNNKVAGVMEFFSSSEAKTDNETIYVMSNIFLEIGSMMDRLEAFNLIKTNEKLAALGRFSAGIAHELRNPLANISALSQLISKNESDGKNILHLNYIIENVKIANKIITDLLGYTTPEELVLKLTDLNIFLNELFKKTEPRFNQSKIKIIKKISANLPSVLFDDLKIENALMNFLTNAMDSMPEGGIIKFTAVKKRFEDCIKIIIEDNGIGIPEDNLDKIFEPFFSTKQNGTGLGMALASQTIKAHGGTISVKSKVNSGTRIEIKFPIKEGGNFE